jgi:hypothetical protein
LGNSVIQPIGELTGQKIQHCKCLPGPTQTFHGGGERRHPGKRLLVVDDDVGFHTVRIEAKAKIQITTYRGMRIDEFEVRSPVVPCHETRKAGANDAIRIEHDQVDCFE